MIKSTGRKKRNKLTIALLSPMLVIVFVVGWIFYIVGQGSAQPKTMQSQKPIHKTPAKQDETELIVIPLEEEQISAK